MALSESQLGTWSSSPSSTKTQFTHEQVRKALEQYEPLQRRDYQIYLQGSYANSTNIKVDSDVDIVVQLNSSFQSDLSGLTLVEKQIYSQTFPNATYGWADFRADVVRALEAYFGSASVKPDNKCVKLLKSEYRVNADIIPCMQHRVYRSFNRDYTENFVEGMKFWTTTGKEIVNFPKVHLENGEHKNGGTRTDTKYKHVVRIVKNIRRRLVDERSFNPDKARSYFVECAVYNAPDALFRGNYTDALANVSDHILYACQPASLVTVSHQHALFGTEPWQWAQSDAAIFFRAVRDYQQSA